MPDPFFSIIIPTYDRLTTLPAAVQSVLNQSYQNFEVIIVDDGSEDGTEEWVKTIKDERIKYIKQQNSGVCAARNNGALEAYGGWICFLDSDDVVSINWLQDFYSLASLGRYDLLFCGMELNDSVLKEKRKVLPSSKYESGRNWWLHNAGVWTVRKEMFFQVGGYDKDLKFGENTELGIRLKALNPRVGIIDRFNFHYSVSVDGGSRNLKEIVRCNELILNKHPAFFAKNKGAKQKFEQALGVGLIRLRRQTEGRHYLWRGYLSNPTNLKAFIIALVGSIPTIASRKWKPHQVK